MPILMCLRRLRRAHHPAGDAASPQTPEAHMKPSLNDHLDPPPPLLDSAAARVAFSGTARQVSDFAAAMVSTTGDSHTHPGEFITQVRQLRKMQVYLTTRAILLERARGTSWPELAAATGISEGWLRANYEPAERRWLAILEGNPLPEPETLDEALELPPPDEPLGDMPVEDEDVRKVAAELDDWCRHRAASIVAVPSEERTPGRPVSEGIEQR